MNMKTSKILTVLLIAILMGSCKQNNWLDWKTQNQIWLLENAKREGVITTPTGLQYKCIAKGPFADVPNSTRPDLSKYVTIDYSGTLINGYEFDASTDASMEVYSLVEGFAEGLKKMSEFDTYEFYIPYDLGYGIAGYGVEGTSSHIPPYSTLIFHVYLKDIQ
jgi:FKBP-type peptidyl-prolyl cis-trans isomerase